MSAGCPAVKQEVSLGFQFRQTGSSYIHTFGEDLCIIKVILKLAQTSKEISDGWNRNKAAKKVIISVLETFCDRKHSGDDEGRLSTRCIDSNGRSDRQYRERSED